MERRFEKVPEEHVILRHTSKVETGSQNQFSALCQPFVENRFSCYDHVLRSEPNRMIHRWVFTRSYTCINANKLNKQGLSTNGLICFSLFRRVELFRSLIQCICIGKVPSSLASHLQYIKRCREIHRCIKVPIYGLLL